MRIAQIAPVIETVPPRKYGGTERVVYHLTEELVKRGHEVTLFASGNSTTSAKLVSVIDRSLREMKIASRGDGADCYSLLNVGLAYQRQKEFDIIHDHTHIIGLATANIATTPTVVTLHDPVFPNYKPIIETLRHPFFVTISRTQPIPAPKMNIIGNVYHGMNMQHYPFAKKAGKYLLFVGNFRKEKGAHTAIEVAKRLNMPLILAGKLDRSWQLEYFNKQIRPHLSPQIKYVGEVTEEKRNSLMRRAYCLLHPIIWREPFGLTLIEAMACACPVVAYNKGSSSEIIKDGTTGFVVENFKQMLKAVKKVDEIDRQRTREYALKNFNAQRMARDYEKIYEKVISISKKEMPTPRKVRVTYQESAHPK